LPRVIGILLTCILPLLASPVAGQEEIILYNETNGLPRTSILDIQRDVKGYFWLATERGLIRFDGRSFIEVQPRDAAYRSQEISRLSLQGNRLYLLYRDSGCMKLDLDSVRFRLVARDRVDDIVELPDGDCVAIFSNGSIARMHRGRFGRRIRYRLSNPARLAYHRGGLMASLPTLGIVKIDPSSLQPRQWFKPSPQGYMDDFVSAEGRLYHLTNGGLTMFDQDLGTARPNPFPELSWVNITHFWPCRDGRNYLIADNKRLMEHRAGRVRPIALPGLLNLELKRLWVEDSSHVLIGTNQGLIHVRMGSNPTTRLMESHEDTTRTLRIRRSLLETDSGRLLLLGTPMPYTLDLPGDFRRQMSRRIDMYDAVRYGHTAYVTTEGGGLIELDTRTFQYRSITPPPIDPKGFYFGILLDSIEGTLLVGGRDEIIRYDVNQRKARTIGVPPGLGSILSLHRDPLSGRLWMGTVNAVVCLSPDLVDVVFIARTGRGLRGKYAATLLARSGTRELWVGHERGVDIIDMDSLRPRGSLPDAIFRNPRVVSILEDFEGRIWMGTYSGIVGYDPRSGEFCRLNRENGLLNIEFNIKSALRLSDGRLVFGGLNGYDMVDPRLIRFSSPGVRGIITGVHRFSAIDTVFESVPQGPGMLGFNIRDEFLRIYLSSSGTLLARKHSYEYDLDGKGQWIAVGEPSYINLLMLDPGPHTVDVRGFDEYGRVLGFERLVIRAREPFLRSRFFQVLLSLAAISFLAMFVVVLLRSRRKEKAIKERISMDLHDEVGTTLTRALYVARLDSGAGRDNRLIHYLNESLFSLRAYINTMNTPSFPFLSLVDEVKEMVHSLMSPSPCHCEVRHVTDGEYLVRGELYRDIRLCLYEIINNMLKHSGGDRLRIVLIARRGLMTLQTTDNGTLQSTDDLSDRGNGIRNLQKRVSKHGGELRMSVGRSGSGLVVRMRFPLRT
jgi:signal transduction histidine kinase